MPVNHFRSFAFLMGLIGCSFYSYWLNNRDFDWVVPYLDERAPAAVRESSEYKVLVGKPLRIFKREAVAESIDVQSHEGKHHITFGQFATSGNKGPNLMCLEYPFIKLSFQGEGMAVAGKQPQMFIVVPCKTDAKNTDMIHKIEIPFSEIYRKPAQDMQFTFPQSKSNSEVYLRNVFGSWPKQWQVESIQFLRDTNDINAEAAEEISNTEIIKNRGEPLLINIRL